MVCVIVLVLLLVFFVHFQITNSDASFSFPKPTQSEHHFHVVGEESLKSGKTLYVGGSGPNNYTKIQDAIDNASTGDTVFIYDDSSPYCESLSVDWPSISIVGENRKTTIIKSPYKNLAILSIVGDEVSVCNLTFLGGDYGIMDEYGNSLFISNCSIDTYHGITLNSKDNTVINSNISNIYVSSSYGTFSSNNSFISCTMGYTEIRSSGNKIINSNISELVLSWASDCSIYNNSIKDGLYIRGEEESYWVHNIKNNTVNEKPLLYYLDKSSFSLADLDVGELILANCSNIYILNVSAQAGILAGYSDNIDFSKPGSPSVYLSHSSNCTIDCRNISESSLYYSEDNVMSGFGNGSRLSLYQSNNNRVYDSKFKKIYMEGGKGNKFLRCNFENHVDYHGVAIELHSTSYNDFSYCNVSNSYYGVWLAAPHNIFHNCNFLNNTFTFTIMGSSNKIIGNIIAYSHKGICVLWSKNNTIQKNLILGNDKGVELDVYYNGGQNKINYNNFVKNEIHAEVYFIEKAMAYNNWNRNYWDNWPKYIPKPIISREAMFGSYFLSLLNIDWLPLPAPYQTSSQLT